MSYREDRRTGSGAFLGGLSLLLACLGHGSLLHIARLEYRTRLFIRGHKNVIASRKWDGQKGMCGHRAGRGRSWAGMPLILCCGPRKANVSNLFPDAAEGSWCVSMCLHVLNPLTVDPLPSRHACPLFSVPYLLEGLELCLGIGRGLEGHGPVAVGDELLPHRALHRGVLRRVAANPPHSKHRPQSDMGTQNRYGVTTTTHIQLGAAV